MDTGQREATFTVAVEERLAPLRTLDNRAARHAALEDLCLALHWALQPCFPQEGQGGKRPTVEVLIDVLLFRLPTERIMIYYPTGALRLVLTRPLTAGEGYLVGRLLHPDEPEDVDDDQREIVLGWY